MECPIGCQLAISTPLKNVGDGTYVPMASYCDRKGGYFKEHMSICQAHLKTRAVCQFYTMLISINVYWDNDTDIMMVCGRQKMGRPLSDAQPLHGLEGQAMACISHNEVDQLPRIESPSFGDRSLTRSV